MDTKFTLQLKKVNVVVDLDVESADQLDIQDEDVFMVDAEDREVSDEKVGKKRKGGAGNKRSVVWKHFKSFVDKKTGKVMAKCNYCKKNLCGNTTNGTTSLRNHVTKCR